MRTPSLLISDANILIDIEDGNLTPFIFQLPYEVAVPDVLFELELKNLHEDLKRAGLKIKSLTSESVEYAALLSGKYARPSILDHMALALALQEQCPLLTGDKELRKAATSEGVAVHGTLWLVEELLKANLIDLAQAKNSFALMKANKSRLPWNDVEELLKVRLDAETPIYT